MNALTNRRSVHEHTDHSSAKPYSKKYNDRADSDSVFPMPRHQSSAWRSYWSHRKDEGDSLINCPNLISAAERLLEIPGFCRASSARVPKELRDSDGDICSYKHLQRLQNKDWANAIVKSLPDRIDECRNGQVLQKLDHALQIDPECIEALKMRATLSIRTGQLTRARHDADTLDAIAKASKSPDSELTAFINDLYEQLDSYAKSLRRERTGRAHSRRRHSRSPRRGRSSHRSHSRSRSRSRRYRDDRDRRRHHYQHHKANGSRRDSDDYRRERRR